MTVLDRVNRWLTRVVDRILFGRPADPPPAWTQRRYRRLVQAGAVIGEPPASGFTRRDEETKTGNEDDQ